MEALTAETPPIHLCAPADPELAELDALRRPRGARRTLRELAAAGLAEPLAGDVVLVDVLLLASQSDQAMRVSLWFGGAFAEWAGSLDHLASARGQAIAQGAGLRLHWHEDFPGQQAWLLRSACARGLSQSLLLFAPDGELRLRIAPMNDSLRRETCAWRTAIEVVREGRAGWPC